MVENRNISRVGESKLNAITQEEIETLTNKQISEKYNVSQTTVSIWCKKNKIKLNRKNKSILYNIPQEDFEKLSTTEISEKYKISKQAVSAWCKKNNIQLKRKKIYRTSKRLNKGMVFERLTVTGLTKHDKRGTCLYECECKCGRTKYFYSWQLTKLHSVDCGCYRKEIIKKMKDDGLLPKSIREKILSLRGHEKMTPKEISQAIDVKISNVRAVLLRNKITVNTRGKSAPKTIEDLQYLIGKKFGRLTVVNVLSPGQIECICDCGKKTTYDWQILENGKVVSCGCYRESLGISRKGESRLNNITKEDIETLSNKEICEKYKLSPAAVYTWYKKNGIKLKLLNITRKPKYSRESLMDLLLEEFKKHGKLTNIEIAKNKNLPAVSTITRAFKTTKMSEVWKEVEAELNY